MAHILAGVDVDAVAVGGIMRVPDDDVLDHDILAIQRMEVPARGILEGAVLQQDALAVAEGKQHGTEEGLDFLLVQGRILIIQRARGGARLRVALVREPGLAVLRNVTAALENRVPLVVGDLAALDLAPEFSAAVEDAAAGDGDVMRAGGVEGRHAAAHVQPLEVRVDDGVQVLVRVEDDDGVLVHEKFDVTLQLDRAGAPNPGGNDEASPALLRELGDRRRESVRVERHAVADAAEVRQHDGAVGDGRKLHPGHIEGKSLIQSGKFVGLRPLAGDGEGQDGKEGKACFHLWLRAVTFQRLQI